MHTYTQCTYTQCTYTRHTQTHTDTHRCIQIHTHAHAHVHRETGAPVSILLTRRIDVATYTHTSIRPDTLHKDSGIVPLSWLEYR